MSPARTFRATLGAAVCLMLVASGCALDTGGEGDESDAFEPAAAASPVPIPYRAHGPRVTDPCLYRLELAGPSGEVSWIEIPLPCDPIWVDRGDPPPKHLDPGRVVAPDDGP